MQEAFKSAGQVLGDGLEGEHQEYGITLSYDSALLVLGQFVKQTMSDMGEYATEGAFQVESNRVVESQNYPVLPVLIWNKLYRNLLDAQYGYRKKVGMSYREVSTVGEVLLKGRLDKHHVEGYLDLLDNFVLAGGMDNEDLRIQFLNQLEGPK